MELSTSTLLAERDHIRKIMRGVVQCKDPDEGATVELLDFVVGCTFRRAALLREAGLLKEVTTKLRNTRSSCTLGWIKVLKEVTSCVAGAREFAAYGGHGALLALLTHGDEEVQSAIDDLLEGATGAASSEAGFPFPSLQFEVLSSDEIAALPLHEYLFDGVEGGSITIVVQPVHGRQKSQFTVGYVMWSSGIILARLLASFKHLWVGKDLHEIGAGLGLAGLVGAMSAQSVVMSDYNPECVRNLRDNCLLNGLGISCVELDWAALSDDDSIGVETQFDCVIASDVVCQVSDAFLVGKVLKRLLKFDGVAIVVLPSPENRFGTESFPAALLKESLSWTTVSVRSQRLLEGLSDASFFSWDVYVITNKVSPSMGVLGDRTDVASWSLSVEQCILGACVQ